MCVWATFLLFSLSADLVGLVMRVPRWLPWAVPAAAWAVAFLGLRVVLTGPKVKEVVVPIKGLAKGLEGLRIVQLSDLHVGPTIRLGYVDQVVETVMSLKPDLVAVTGDLADGTPESLAPHMRPLENLKAALGVFYVTGNHEYYWGADRWVKRVKELGFIPLMNENRLVDFRGAKVLVGGVTDTSGGHFLPTHDSDPKLAAAGGQTRDFSLLLAHRPDSCLEAEPAGFDLQLSGHTHGGQFFPASLLIPLFHRYSSGLNRHGRLWLYVNSGTGYWGPPHRFAVPAEITLLTLARSEP
jgi:predicted MPP superfamily phosphohydrolase